jgi:hypothetical protein
VLDQFGYFDHIAPEVQGTPVQFFHEPFIVHFHFSDILGYLDLCLSDNGQVEFEAVSDGFDGVAEFDVVQTSDEEVWPELSFADYYDRFDERLDFGVGAEEQRVFDEVV